MSAETQVEHVTIVFKTHLDVGFTDYAASVIGQYFSTYIPGAIRLAREFREKGGEERFRWSLASWIVYEYLEQASAQDRQMVEDAIAAGDIAWHALPFTLHTELMDASLFRFGLSLAQELDQRYGKQTIAAKMTDVPGHTRGIVPLLAEAGVRFLHIGVNAASTAPDVPGIFVWKDTSTNTDVIVMYHDDYGDVTLLPGTTQAVAVVMTGDNHGPPSAESVTRTYTRLRERFPHATLEAGTLDDIARQLIPIADQLPVITSEIGDTWIHGGGTDPTKIRQYRALLRLRQQWDAAQEDVKAFSRRLMLVPEHTWGMDEKTYLPDKKTYENEALADARQTELFKHFEASWAEQRGYITEAIALLNPDRQVEAELAIATTEPQRHDLRMYQQRTSLDYEASWGRIRFHEVTGAIIVLDVNQQVWADREHPLASLSYEVFSSAEYERFYSQYIRTRHDVQEWATEDFTKPGLPVQDHYTAQPHVIEVYERNGNGVDDILFALEFPTESRQFGTPRSVWLKYRIHRLAARIDVTLRWFDKPACRLAEAFWLSFSPLVAQPERWQMRKLGQWVSPLDVVSKGARTLHAVQDALRYTDNAHEMQIETLDAPLVAPGKPSLLNFHNQLPNLAGGMHINLYNNVWGTNFPMWFEDDALFRFTLTFGTADQ